MVRETVDAIFDKGPAKALTGPISRGDAATVKRQYAMVRNWDPSIGEFYRGLGLIAVALAESDQRLSSERAQELRAALSGNE
ncbi:MAG TPA: DUF2520 domain-containing protein, partial [Burkholderiales bacterium]|nr:DUF2520 domain-containing protein [Burkholderiales bacterium]